MAWMSKHILTICFFLVMCYLTVKVVPIHGETTPHSQSQVEPKPNRQSSGPINGSHKLERVGSIADNGYDPDYGWFSVKISLGTPQQNYSLIIDTGSRSTWVRCLFCTQGCTSDDPPYDPSKSSCQNTFKNPFTASYGDNSYAIGFWVCDTLIIDGLDSIKNFEFGCAQRISDGNGENFVNAAGFLGLGKGDSSLVSQGGASMKAFSYFVPENDGGGDLQFGDKATEKSNTCTNQITSMLSGGDQEKYYIDLVGISVDGNELSVPSTEFTSGGTIIDSGTVITRLPQVVYSALRDAFRQYMFSYTLLDRVDELMDTCYSLEGIESIALPEIKFHFGQENTIDVTLTKEGTIWRKDDTVSCLAFAATHSYGIIGIVQQRGFNVLYDLEGQTIGFGTNCA
ncbi:aspartyl protease AED1-like [Solanum dulcamara]|uniref:aspartyl protease AED1-like n=1 Tax=Solanum dulcamara TaxID=45834 RepID=UPI00248653B5|nr:aspartyl protease AED1-like [Solanum dulcamara]